MSAAEGDGWMDRGACLGSDPDLFHPFPSEKEKEQKAKAICAKCPVRETCLEWALTRREDKGGGIWGGLSSRELYRLRIARRHKRRTASAR